MDSPPPNDAPPTPGLPPVQPPSGRFIVQLFVVPGVIILVVVLIVMGLTFLAKRERHPDQFLAQLDSDNELIRWRGASDLAQILKRSEPATLRWKADPAFALALTERLETAYVKLLEEEKVIAKKIETSTDPDKQLLWRGLRGQRDYLGFLASSLGDFHVPVGAPVLCKILQYDNSPDVKGNKLQRRKALVALMNMGENAKGFATIPAQQRDAVLATLKEEAGKNSTRADAARTGLWYLDKTALPSEKLQNITKVDETLAACSKTDDRFLRQLIAMSFTFWDGDLAEPTLLTLAEDKGRGEVIRVEDID